MQGQFKFDKGEQNELCMEEADCFSGNLSFREEERSMMEIKGPQDLENEVIKSGLCTLCGACAGLCPYFRAYRGKVVFMDNCNLSQGRCYAFCPRTPSHLENVNRAVFGVPYPGDSLGTYRRAIMARSTEPSILAKAQYGGVTSALVSLAIKKKIVEAAVLTKKDRDLLSCGALARNKKEVLACAGSNYVASPTLESFNRCGSGSTKSFAVVGVPCQVLALGKMRINPLAQKNNIEKLGLVIGLFCTWALSYKEFQHFLKKDFPSDRIRKMDIPPPPANVFEIDLPEGRKTIPLDRIRPFIRPACTVCLDMTAEFADLSVGAVEGIPGWNTIIIRTARGEELLEQARKSKVIETAELPQANFNHLKEAALLKKRRALQNIVQRTGRKDDWLYIQGADSLKSLID
jgi:coenzyme F420 hydrogenase subunit beta